MAAAFVVGDTAAMLGEGWIALTAVLTAAAAYMWAIRRRRCRVWHIAIVLFILYGFVCGAMHTNSIIRVKGLLADSSAKSATVVGTVYKIRDKSHVCEIYLRDTSVRFPDIPDETQLFDRLIVYSSEYGTCSEGDIIQITGSINAWDTANNRGEFNTQQYYASLNIYAGCRAENLQVVSENQNQFLTAIFKFRGAMMESYRSLDDSEDAGIFISMILGDKSELAPDISTLYQHNGIAHILAISGLHISMIGMTIYSLLRKSGLGFSQCALVSTFVIIAYGILTGNAVSSVRALIMFIAEVYAQVMGRKYDRLSAMSLAAIIILADMPGMLGNSAFLLSFGAVAGIETVYPALSVGLLNMSEAQGRIAGSLGKMIGQKIVSALMVSFSVSLTTLPVILVSFHELPLYSVFLNLIVVSLMGIVMSAALMGGILGIICRPAGKLMLGSAHYVLALYKVMCKAVMQLPFSRLIPGDADSVRIWLYYILLAVIVLASALSGKLACAIRRTITLACTVAMLVLIFVKPSDTLEIRMLCVGQGDGILIKAPAGINILMDGGSTDEKKLGEYTLVPCLKAAGAGTIDYAIVSHTDEDHISGVRYLLGTQSDTGIKINNLIMPDIADSERDKAYSELVAMAEENGTKVHYISRNNLIKTGDGGAILECLYPYRGAGAADKNELSLVLKLTYGSFSMLFTGDIEKDGEDELAAQGCLTSCDVLKVGHHGSDNATKEQLLAQVRPKVALISCGAGNRYGHPGKKLLQRLTESGCDIYITSINKEIVITSDGSSFDVTAFYMP